MRAYHAQAVTKFSILRWELASLIARFRTIEAITPLDAYIASIERMVVECQSAGIRAVIVSSFMYGSRYTMKGSDEYVEALRMLKKQIEGMILIDCSKIFMGYSKSIILQHDGFHLSELGQRLVGEAIAAGILADVAKYGFGVGGR